jgi:hypothetical protein
LQASVLFDTMMAMTTSLGVELVMALPAVAVTL